MARRAPVLPVAPRKYPRWTAFAWGLRDKAFGLPPRQLDAPEGAGVGFSRFPLEDGELPGVDGCIWAADFEVFRCGCRPICPCAKASARHRKRPALLCGCGGMMYYLKASTARRWSAFCRRFATVTDRLQRFGYVLVADLKTGTYPLMSLPCGDGRAANMILKPQGSRPN
ncbi:MAG: hypothetical protein ACLUMK_09205 [Christensenellales bacterium]